MTIVIEAVFSETLNEDTGELHTVREPAVGRCDACGAFVTLEDGLDNLCACGACYNGWGQRVRPSWECDDEGNPHDIW